MCSNVTIKAGKVNFDGYVWTVHWDGLEHADAENVRITNINWTAQWHGWDEHGSAKAPKIGSKRKGVVQLEDGSSFDPREGLLSDAEIVKAVSKKCYQWDNGAAYGEMDKSLLLDVGLKGTPP